MSNATPNIVNKAWNFAHVLRDDGLSHRGDIYEGLLAKSAAESPKGAGQHFTPRELIKAVVRLRAARQAGRGEPGHFPAQGREPGGFRGSARPERVGPGRSWTTCRRPWSSSRRWSRGGRS